MEFQDLNYDMMHHVKNQNIEGMRSCLERGFDVNQYGSYGSWKEAVIGDNLEIVKILLIEGHGNIKDILYYVLLIDPKKENLNYLIDEYVKFRKPIEDFTEAIFDVVSEAISDTNEGGLFFEDYFYNFILKELIRRGLDIYKNVDGKNIFTFLREDKRDEIFNFTKQNIKSGVK